MIVLNKRSVNLAISILKLIISFLSVGSIMITFFKGVNQGIFLTLSIYFFTKLVDHIEIVLKNPRVNNQKAAIINTVNFFLDIIFFVVDFLSCFQTYPVTVIIIICIFNMFCIMYFLFLEAKKTGHMFYSHQKY